MLLYAEGNQDSILSCQIFVKRTYDFPKRSAWEDEKSQLNLQDSKNGAFIKKKEKVFFEKIVFQIDKMLLD